MAWGLEELLNARDNRMITHLPSKAVSDPERQKKLIDLWLEIDSWKNDFHDKHLLTALEYYLHSRTYKISDSARVAAVKEKTISACNYAVKHLPSVLCSPEETERMISSLGEMIGEGSTDTSKNHYRTFTMYCTFHDGDREARIDIYAPPEKVEEEIRTLCAWWVSIHGRIHPLELAARLYCTFLYIHPFCDGNGRIAKILAGVYLASLGYPAPECTSLDYLIVDFKEQVTKESFIVLFSGTVKATMEHFSAFEELLGLAGSSAKENSKIET